MRRATRLAGLAGLLLALAARGQGEAPEPPPLESMTGAQVYEHLCSRCHGATGRGDVSPEILAGMEVAPRDLTEPYFNTRERRSDWQRVVREGGAVVGLSSSMPTWGEALSERQILEVVEHMKGFVDQSKYPSGDVNFFRAHRVTKAFVEQEALLIAQLGSHRQEAGATGEASLLLYYANRFGGRFQYEVKVPLEALYEGGGARAGLGDVELGLKWAFFDDHRWRVITSAGFEVALPMGNAAEGFGAGTVVAVPYLAGGLGLGRFVQLQSSVKLEAPLDRARGAPELRYAAAAILTLPEGKQGLFPGLEVFGTRPLGEPGYSVSILPTLYWGITQLGHVAVSAAVELPIAGTRSFDYRVHAFLLWDYVDGPLF